MSIFDIIFAILGLIVGLFTWSAFWGTLFATIPVKLRAKREGLIKSTGPLLITGQLLFSVIAIIAMFIFVKPMFYGSLVASLIMLFSISKLRREATENMLRDIVVDKHNN